MQRCSHQRQRHLARVVLYRRLIEPMNDQRRHSVGRLIHEMIPLLCERESRPNWARFERFGDADLIVFHERERIENIRVGSSHHWR